MKTMICNMFRYLENFIKTKIINRYGLINPFKSFLRSKSSWVFKKSTTYYPTHDRFNLMAKSVQV